MNELRLILLAYMQNLVEWARRHLNIKKVHIYPSPKKYFKKGDFVESKEGRKGKVWRIYIKIATGEPKGCTVVWDDDGKGEKVSPFVPVIDKSPKFNPIIRMSN